MPVQAHSWLTLGAHRLATWVLSRDSPYVQEQARSQRRSGTAVGLTHSHWLLTPSPALRYLWATVVNIVSPMGRS